MSKASVRPAAAPQVFGRYELLGRIASGGMAEIFVARVSSLAGVNKFVVVKRLLPEHAGNREYIQMFLDEARVAAGLNHPNVVQMHDCGEEAGRHYIAMEFLHGEDLRSVLKQLRKMDRRLPLELALQVATGVCAGLHHAHEARGIDGKPMSIVHRDISPQNVFLTFDGATKLVDFGIAKSSNRKTETRAGTIKGKVPYMAPEQLRGEPGIDRRCDVYAVGVLLYEMTTNSRPYAVGSAGEFALMVAITQGKLRPPSQLDPSYPPELERIVMKALARSPDGRYPDARAMQLDLENFAKSIGADPRNTALATFLSGLFGDRAEAWRGAIESRDALLAQVAALSEHRAQQDDPEDDLMPDGAPPQAPPPAPSPAPARAPRAPVAVGIDVSHHEQDGVHQWALRGKLTEGFRGATLGAEIQGPAILDLSGVERVTSFGVREWLAFLEATRPLHDRLYLARCSEAFANQLSMIRAMAGDTWVISLLAPYTCERCGQGFKRLLDCERDAAALQAHQPPGAPCPSCGGDGRFDDDPGYLSFLDPWLGRSPPPAIRAALDAAERQGASAQDAVEKVVEGNTTHIKVRKPLDRGLRWARILDGIEGQLSLEFQENARLQEGGAAGLVRALQTLDAEVRGVELIGAPAALLGAMKTLPPRVNASSVLFEGHCESCAGPRTALVTERALDDAISADTAVPFLCRRCGGPLRCDDSEAALQAWRPGYQPPEPATEIAAAPSIAPEPAAPAPASPPAPPAPARSPLLVPLALLLTFAIALLGAFALRRSAAPAGAAPPGRSSRGPAPRATLRLAGPTPTPLTVSPETPL